MVKFIEDRKDPVVMVPKSLEIAPANGVCTSFLSRAPYVEGWKTLCPHMFHSIDGDEMLEFVACLTGFLAMPELCGLMGCEGRALVQKG